MTTIETLYQMRDKALHRYRLAKTRKKRADEEYQFQVRKIDTINQLIEEEKGRVAP